MGRSVLRDRGRLGRWRLGQRITFFARTKDGNNTPTGPTAHPTLKVYDEAEALVETVYGQRRDSLTMVGFFKFQIDLDSDYSPGRHTAIIDYAISGTNYGQEVEFEVMRGGHEKGYGLAASEFNSKFGPFLVVQYGPDNYAYPNPR